MVDELEVMSTTIGQRIPTIFVLYKKFKIKSKKRNKKTKEFTTPRTNGDTSPPAT